MPMYNTGNPVGSSAPKDLYDNAQVLDKLVIGTDPFVTDRLGAERYSWAGMEYDFQNAQTGRQSEFNAAQTARQQAFDDFLIASGYEWVGDYGPGLLFERRNQYMVRDGVPYRIAPTVTLPYTTTGNWATEVSNFVALDPDATLRQDLLNTADPTKNSELMAHVRKSLTFASLFTVGRALDTQTIDPWEKASLITDKPDANDPATWDWAPAIQAAIDASPAGGVVDLKGRSYTSSRVSITKPFTLRNGIIEAHTSTDTAVVHIVGATKVHIDALKVKVDYPAKTFTSANVSGIQADTSDQVLVTNCEADGSKNDDYGAGSWGCPIHAFNSTNITIAFSVARNAHKEGIMTRQSDNTTIAFCKAYSCGNSGLGTSRGLNPRVVCSESYASGASSISVNGSGYLVFGNIADGNLTQNGITIGHSEDSQQWSGVGYAGANQVTNSAGWGILVADPTMARIEGNSLFECDSGGCLVTTAGTAPAGATIMYVNNQAKTLGGHGFRSTLNGDHYLIDNLFDGITGTDQHGFFTDSARLNKLTNNVWRNIANGRGIYSAHLSGDANARSDIDDNEVLSVGKSGIVVGGGVKNRISRNTLSGFNTTASAAETAVLVNAAVAGHALEFDIVDNFMEGTFGATATSAIYITGTPAGAGTRSLRVDRNRAPGATVLVGGAPTNFDKISIGGGGRNRIGTSAMSQDVNVAASNFLDVSNSNLQALGNWPQMIPLNQYFGQVYVESFGNGTMRLRNLGANAATARLIW